MDNQEFFDKVNKTLEPLKTLRPLKKDPDLVRVVRCRDCRFWYANNAEEGDASGMCMNGYSSAGTTDMMWFCADGEREE